MCRNGILILIFLPLAFGCAISPPGRTAGNVQVTEQPPRLPTVKAGNIEWNSRASVRSGWLALPMIENAMPGLLVVAGKEGLTAGARREAERFAAHGYAVLAVESSLSPEEIRSAREFLGAIPETRDHPIGCLGWGAGGRAAFHLALEGRLRACVVLGELPAMEDLAAFQQLQTPVLVIAGGEQDQEAVQMLRDGLALSGVTHEVMIDPAQPALGLPGNAAVHSSPAGIRAKERTAEFLAEHLGSGYYY